MKIFFTVRVVNLCNRLSREVVDNLSLEVFKDGTFFGQPDLAVNMEIGSPAFQQGGWSLMILEVP